MQAKSKIQLERDRTCAFLEWVPQVSGDRKTREQQIADMRHEYEERKIWPIEIRLVFYFIMVSLQRFASHIHCWAEFSERNPSSCNHE